MKIRPVNDNVLIERLPSEYGGNILVPETSQAGSTLGRVWHVGPGRFSDDTETFHPTIVREGDIVAFNEHSGISLDDVFLIIGEWEIIGIFCAKEEELNERVVGRKNASGDRQQV